MRILIIGASSFLGGHLLRAASAAGHTVLTSGRSGDWSLRLDLVADPPERVASLIATAAPDVVVNCAGATSGGADVLAAANITGVHTLVTALLAGARTGRGRGARERGRDWCTSPRRPSTGRPPTACR